MDRLFSFRHTVCNYGMSQEKIQGRGGGRAWVPNPILNMHGLGDETLIFLVSSLLLCTQTLNMGNRLIIATFHSLYLQGRAIRDKGARSAGGVLAFDPRAGFLPLELPPPGNPELWEDSNNSSSSSSSSSRSPWEYTWTIRIDESAAVTAAIVSGPPSPSVAGTVAAGGGGASVEGLDSSSSQEGDRSSQGGLSDCTWGLVMKEAGRTGNLCVERCEALKVHRSK